MSVKPAKSSMATQVLATEVVDSSSLLELQTKIAIEKIDEQSVAAALLTHLSVDDCVVMLRQSQTGEEALVAYTVLTGQFSPERLQGHLESAFAGTPLPKIYFVPVSTLPLTAEGEIDRQALSQIPVIENGLVEEWENRLRSLPEIEQAAVVVEDHTEKISPIHLSDLLPNWKTASESAAVSTAVDTPAPSTGKVEDSAPKPLAISTGAPLTEEAGAPQNLAEALARTAQKSPNKGIIYLDSDGSETVQLYPALLEQAQRILAGLRKLGLQPQDKVLFQFDNNQDFFPAFWGCTLGGFVPVPISAAPAYEASNSTVKKLQNAWLMLDRPLVLTNNSLAPQVRSLSGKLNLENFQVAAIDDFRDCAPDLNWHNSLPEDLALLLLTSGSTGVPKGVTLRHRNLISSVTATSAMSNFTQEDVSLNWLPLDHPGPIVRCVIRTTFLGCQQIHAPTGAVLADPLKWFDWIERYRATTTWAPNFAYALVNDRAEAIKKRHWDLSSVRSILNTAEPIAVQTAKKFLELLAPYGLEATAMQSSWGMAETASSVTVYDRYLIDSTPNQQSASFADLGSPIPGTSLRIINAQNEVVEEGTIGNLQIKGSTVTAGYYNNPELNKEMFTEDGWFNTGDLAFLHQGRLTITGRTKDIIIINGSNYYTHEIEAVVEEVAGIEVSYTAACATRKPGSNTDELIVFFNTEISEDERLLELLKDIQKTVVRRLGISPTYLIPVEKEVIPKTSIGKIQRSQLKQGFESGTFDAIVKRIDVLLGNKNTLPDWFYRKVWRPKQITAFDNKPKAGQSLVFLDSLGLGELLLKELSKNGASVVAVEAGTEFAKLADNHYRIDPKNPEHYQQLLQQSVKDNSPIEQILHLWSYDKYQGEIESLETLETAQNKGIYSLLFLVQALSEIQGSKTPVRLDVIASHVQPVEPDDEIACERSPILGFVKTIPQEFPWIDCRHLDLSTEQNEENAGYILQELQGIQRESEVAYRSGKRLVSRLEKCDFSQEEKQALPFKAGGMYLITGGLGGIGTEIAQYLLKNYQARLLLIGRTPLPERSTWESKLEQSSAGFERIKAYLELEKLGGEIAYEAVDISDFAGMQQVVEGVKSRWQCELDGVIHLAGVTSRRLLTEETEDSVAGTLRPKVHGTWVLHQLLKNQPNGVFITFSSVNGFFGGFSAGAYSAANNFLDYFCYYQRHKTSLQSYCFAWSMWDEMGMSRNYEMKELTRARGYYLISAEQGLHSIPIALQYHQAHTIVGLDGSNPQMLRYMETDSYALQKLSAYFTAAIKDLAATQLPTLEVGDQFGTPSRCKFQQLAEMPVAESGEIDKAQLTAKSRGTTAERVAPRDEIERQLAGIWQEVLGVSELGIHDNFFELGGSSLLAIQLFARIEEQFNQKLPLATLFESPTVEQLANIFRPSEVPVSFDSLVAIKSGDAYPPLFLVHDADGETMLYLNLARLLNPERPVYGLRPYSKNGFPILHTRLSEMVNYYIEKIRNVQPQGPYLLGGLCAGGVIAYAIAEELQTQGEKVALVALIDSLDVQAPRKIARVAKKQLSRFSQVLNQDRQLNKLERFAAIVNKASKKARNWLAYEIGSRVESSRNKFKVMLYRYYLDKGLPAPQFLQDLSVRTIYRIAAKEYMPQGYQGQLALFRATEGEGIEEPAINLTNDPLFGWGKRATKGVVVYDIPGGHSSMLQDPNVQVMAEKLNAYIHAALAEESVSK
ncbi:SDR family NAD(P)-dependent oxidoreductase [Microcoleus sp. FACHB-672]|uniref:SDR family NAD(P)-dependent oxidoreductase n=1 Tax=Microcoleus sp. FACHB-672 TaxID=2692825 RepID=UPI00198F01A1|nr:SDR family NAD(P)-dependent oxidoreductase [Microcoleus sp. FACHB-672]MBD2043729.1 SDR family NAD(P)-dependent oxidoreductase [Microcoleus sp. FACHB-672]